MERGIGYIAFLKFAVEINTTIQLEENKKMTSTIKFGLCLPMYGGWLIGAPAEEPEISYRYLERVAWEAEDLGYDSLWVPDHLPQ